ncbi:MAG: MerC domain-containing protein [Bdellovibrionia bacterium]
MNSFWDKVGILISGFCALHCVATPFLIFSLPALGYAFEHPLFHFLLALFVVPVGVFAFYQGYKQHHQKGILLLGFLGLFVIGAMAAVPHAWLHVVGHNTLTLVGSGILILAHVLNRRQCLCHIK